jgi:uroporphyrinogen-III synthase
VRVVLTRPRGRGEEWRRRLEAAGHDVTLVPLTEIRDGDPFPDPAPYDGVLFTSVAAVERAPEGVTWPRVGAVGSVTAQALAERGIEVDVVGTAGGEELARQWGEAIENAMGHRLLLPQARRARAELEVALRKMGAEVDCVAVYETLPAARVDRIALGSADVIAFFAPSAVRVFAQLKVDTNARFWGLGDTTRAAMAAAGIEHSDVPELDA